jgi:subtilisin family serine protease
MNNIKTTIFGYLITSFAVLAMVLAFTGQTSAEKGGSVRKIVMFKKNFKNVEAQKGLLQSLGIEGEGFPLGLINGMAVTLPEEAINALAGSEEVLLVEDDIKVHATDMPDWAGIGKNNYAGSSSQFLPWGVDRIDAELVWPSKGIGVRVAVLDSGIAKKHPDLAVAGGINFVGRTPEKNAPRGRWIDDNGHGTHVAGTIGALDNGFGVVGVAPDVSLYAVKVLGSDGFGDVSDLIAGIQWAVENNMHLVNMSLGTDVNSPALETACEEALAAGLILVAAAGNDGPSPTAGVSTVDYPAAYLSVIAVAAVDSLDEVTDESSQGDEVDIAGPGMDIVSTSYWGGINAMSGTSMAAPHVTGALALRISEDLLNGEMGNLLFYKELLCTTADDIDALPIDAGCGLLDAEELVTGDESGNNLTL